MSVSIQSLLTQTKRFESFFGPVILEPGINDSVHPRVWQNLKSNNPDIQVLIKQGLLIEIDDQA